MKKKEERLFEKSYSAATSLWDERPENHKRRVVDNKVITVAEGVWKFRDITEKKLSLFWWLLHG